VPAAGDLGASVGVIAVCRDCNIHSTPSGWHFGHEVQGQLSAGFVGGIPSNFWVAGLSPSIDVFHRQFQSVLGQLDWHALVAQAFANIAFPDNSSANDILQIGGGLGTGLELHPGHQNRLSITAALMVVGQDSVDLRTGSGTPSGGLVFQLSVTANLLNP
jgi:hypothetical protein